MAKTLWQVVDCNELLPGLLVTSEDISRYIISSEGTRGEDVGNCASVAGGDEETFTLYTQCVALAILSSLFILNFFILHLHPFLLFGFVCFLIPTTTTSFSFVLLRLLLISLKLGLRS